MFITREGESLVAFLKIELAKLRLPNDVAQAATVEAFHAAQQIYLGRIYDGYQRMVAFELLLAESSNASDDDIHHIARAVVEAASLRRAGWLARLGGVCQKFRVQGGLNNYTEGRTNRSA